jgi:hypothetical protein
MCQATGYKLKSNKELPCAFQVFSKLIPMTTNEVKENDDNTLTFTDTVNGNQLYPMYSVLEFEHTDDKISAINVKMCRIAGIFKADGKDSFTQTSYGTKKPSIYYLIEVNGNNVGKVNSILGYNDDNKIKESDYMYGAWVPEGDYNGSELNSVGNKYLYIQY